jgi:A/G-specific adenine glycosylase
MDISAALIGWYKQNKRDLPWRNTHDPYRIWLSEVILQQTRVNQGIDYYYRFIEHFPDVQSLAGASEEEVLKLWQGLGYYSRARNLHHAARYIAGTLKGAFPENYAELLKLKGIGEYTAAAVSSIAYGEVKPVIDGNVVRVLSRLYAIDDASDSTTGKKILRTLASQLIDADDPATFNQSIMEFGAMHCRPANPMCETCPLQPACHAFRLRKTSAYPVKLPRTSVKELYLYYMVILFPVGKETHILLNRRSTQGIWRNLYDFPHLESFVPLQIAQVLSLEPAGSLLENLNTEVSVISDEYVHILSHRKIRARFIRIQSKETIPSPGVFRSIPVQRIGDFPVPRLIERYLNDEKIRG